MSDDFNTEWDVEKYKTDYESDEHWELKKSFIDAHKTKYPEKKLICLAQVFFNMEFMGCRYPSETMILVNELSQDIAKDFRDSRKDRLKRTFVSASDAIEARFKGTKATEVSLLNRFLCFSDNLLIVFLYS